MQYILDKTTERSKFLVVCRSSYKLIRKLVDFNIEKINDNSYEPFVLTKTLKILLQVNQNKSDLIIEEIKKSINENSISNSRAAEILKSDLQNLTADFIEHEELGDYNTNEGIYSIPLVANNNIEPELIGNLSYYTDDSE